MRNLVFIFLCLCFFVSNSYAVDFRFSGFVYVLTGFDDHLNFQKSSDIDAYLW